MILDLHVVLLSLLGQGSSDFLFMVDGLILNLLDRSDIDELFEVLSTLCDMVTSVEASVLATWRVGEVVIKICSLRLLTCDCAKILIAHI